jgi:hypothetical protein
VGRERAQCQGARAPGRVRRIIRCRLTRRPVAVRPRRQQRGGGDVALACPHHRHQAELVTGRRRDRQRDRADRGHLAGNLDHEVRRQRRDRAAVGHVEDQPGRGPAAQRGGEGDRHRLVAARRDVSLVPVAGLLAGPQLGQVAAVALVVGLPPEAGRVRGRRRRGRVERLLPLADVLAAGPPGRPHIAQRLGVGVVPVEVLVGDRAERPQDVRAEQPALLGRQQPSRVAQQAGQQVGAARAQAAQPAQVVDAEVVGVHPVGDGAQGGSRVHAAGRAGPADQADRGVADADHPRPEHPGHHLGNDASRVGHRDDPGGRCQGGDPAGDHVGHRHRPGGARQPAGTDGLLAEHAAGERRPLVTDPAVKATRPERREYDIGPAYRRVEAGRGGHRQGVFLAASAASGAVARQHAGDHREAAGIGVVQDHLRYRQAAGRELPGDERHPEAAAAENRDAHAPDTTGRRTAGRRGPADRVQTPGRGR